MTTDPIALLNQVLARERQPAQEALPPPATDARQQAIALGAAGGYRFERDLAADPNFARVGNAYINPYTGEKYDLVVTLHRPGEDNIYRAGYNASQADRQAAARALGVSAPAGTTPQQRDFRAEQRAEAVAIGAAGGYRFERDLAADPNFVRLGNAFINPRTGEKYDLVPSLSQPGQDNIYRAGYSASQADRQAAARLQAQAQVSVGRPVGALLALPAALAAQPAAQAQAVLGALSGLERGAPAVFGRDPMSLAGDVAAYLATGYLPEMRRQQLEPWVQPELYRRGYRASPGLELGSVLVPQGYAGAAYDFGREGAPWLAMPYGEGQALLQATGPQTAMLYEPEAVTGFSAGELLRAHGYAPTGDPVRDAMTAARIYEEQQALLRQGYTPAQVQGLLSAQPNYVPGQSYQDPRTLASGPAVDTTSRAFVRAAPELAGLPTYAGAEQLRERGYTFQGGGEVLVTEELYADPLQRERERMAYRWRAAGLPAPQAIPINLRTGRDARLPPGFYYSYEPGDPRWRYDIWRPWGQQSGDSAGEEAGEGGYIYAGARGGEEEQPVYEVRPPEVGFGTDYSYSLAYSYPGDYDWALAYERGGTFLAPEEIVGVGRFTGTPYFRLGEGLPFPGGNPERLTITPLRGQERRRIHEGLRALGPQAALGILRSAARLSATRR